MSKNKKHILENEEVVKSLKELLDNQEKEDKIIDLVYKSHRKVADFFDKRSEKNSLHNKELQSQV